MIALLLACAAPEVTPSPEPGTPVLAVRPEALDFGTVGEGVHTVTLLLENAGDGTLTGGLDAERPLAVDVVTFALGPGEQALVEVELDASAGELAATIGVTSNGGEVDVPVRATVSSPSAVASFEGPTSVAITCAGAWEGALRNGGDAPLAVYGVTADQGVVAMTPAILAPGEDLALSVDLGALPDGEHVVTLVADTDAGTATTSFTADVDHAIRTETATWRGDRVDLLLATEVPGVGSFNELYEELEARLPQIAAHLAASPLDLDVALVLDVPPAPVLEVGPDAAALADALGAALAAGTMAWEDPIVRAGEALDGTPGFPRADTNLAVVLLHDEDNGPVGVTAEDVLDAWSGLVSEDALLTVHGMAPLTECNESVATWIPALVEPTGGALHSLCTRDYDRFFEALLAREDELLRTFPLTGAPDDGVTVTVGGAPADGTITSEGVRVEGSFAFGDVVVVTYAECP